MIRAADLTGSSQVFLVAACRSAGIPTPTPEFRFHSVRKWRFDWAWVDHKVALEVNGGVFTGGRHVRGAALLREYEKLNEAAALGWRVLFVTPKQFAEVETFVMIRRALESSEAA